MSLAARGPGEWLVFVGGLAGGAAILSAGLIVLLRPLLVRYALARPSARGLHSIPTPQGGGIAVLCACAAAVATGAAFLGLGTADILRLTAVLVSATVLAALGLFDDIRPLPALPRLLIQLLAMAIGVAALPEGTRVLPFLPPGLEPVLLVIGGAWFINLTNFMDGMDWMTVVTMAPLSAVLVLACVAGHLSVVAGLLALGLLGGLLGYAPFNRPVARLFLGDVGSLPVGFLVTYGLLSLAGRRGEEGQFASAVLLALYYIADSGITLLWRVWHRQRVWEPHRSHFYQVAIARGLTVWQVLARVGAANLALAVLSWLSLGGSFAAQVDLSVAGCLVVAVALLVLSRGRDPGESSAA